MDKFYLFSGNVSQALKVSKTLIIFILLVAIGQVAVCVPLIVNVGIGQTYTSLTNTGGLFAALNTGDFNGASVATIISDITETGAVSLTATLFIGSLTIQSDGTMRTLSGATSADNIPLINIYGADNVTFDGGVGKMLTFKNATGVSSILRGPVIQFKYGSLNGVIKNCNIQSNTLSTSIGAITIGSGTNSVIISDCEIRNVTGTIGVPATMIYSGSASECSNTISITNNNIYNWKTYGVNFVKVANGCNISGNSFFMQTETLGINPNYSQTAIYVHAGNSHFITGNFIGGQSAKCLGGVWTNATSAYTNPPTFSKAIHLESTTTSQPSIIEGNTIRNMMISGTGNLYGIHIDVSVVNVKKNKIVFNIGASSSSTTIYGVYNQSFTLANEFSNNMIAIGGGNATIYGFNNPNTNSPAVLYYNSINIYGAESGTNYSFAFNRKGSAQCIFYDNILSNVRTDGTGKHYAISSSITGFNSDFNDYYAIGDVLAMWGTTDKADLAAWKASSSMDANSVNVPPGFTSDVDLHITNNSSIATKGITVPLIDDIDGFLRSATPDMGINKIGVTNNWTGATSTDWNVAGNWTGGIPGSASNVIINAPALNYPHITITTPAVCNDLAINPAASLTIDAGKALTVNGILTNNNTTGIAGIIIQSDATGTGSLIISGTATGTGTAVNQRYMTKDAWHIVSSPLSGQKIANFLVANTIIQKAVSDPNKRRMMDYDPINNVWNINYFTNTTPGDLEKGKGYAMHIRTDGIVTFTGSLQAGPLLVTGLTEAKWNCIGNPYTSAIGMNLNSSSINKFLEINSANLDPNNGAIYVWEHFDPISSVAGKYSVHSNATAPINFQQGQAFLVKMNTGATSISFSSDMQIHNTNLELKSSNIAWPTIKLKASVGDMESSTIIAFNNAMTKGLDPTYDAGLLKGSSDLVVYSRLVEDNGIPFAIQALPDNDYSTMVIPIGLDFITGGEVVFSSELMNLPLDCKVILEDKLTNTFTDLSRDTYKTTIAANSIIADRFRLKTSNATTGLDKGTLTANLTAYANGNIEIHVIGHVSKNAVAMLYDIHGRNVLVKKLEDGNKNSIPLPNPKVGIYMLTVNDKGKLSGFKILVRE